MGWGTHIAEPLPRHDAAYLVYAWLGYPSLGEVSECPEDGATAVITSGKGGESSVDGQHGPLPRPLPAPPRGG
jgi:hypothetical protein